MFVLLDLELKLNFLFCKWNKDWNIDLGSFVFLSKNDMPYSFNIPIILIHILNHFNSHKGKILMQGKGL